MHFTIDEAEFLKAPSVPHIEEPSKIKLIGLWTSKSWYYYINDQEYQITPGSYEFVSMLLTRQTGWFMFVQLHPSAKTVGSFKNNRHYISSSIGREKFCGLRKPRGIVKWMFSNPHSSTVSTLVSNAGSLTDHTMGM